jgi:hypothetical protein
VRPGVTRPRLTSGQALKGRTTVCWILGFGVWILTGEIATSRLHRDSQGHAPVIKGRFFATLRMTRRKGIATGP